MKLNLGVRDVAYTDAEGSTTTGKVAEILESDYHVMEVFYELHESEVSEHLSEEFATAIDNVAHGKPFALDAVGPMHRIEVDFRDYLDRREWERTTGQTILAAQLGISHRFKSVKGGTLSAARIASGSVKAKGKVLKRNRGPRPAFVDTGLFAASFAAWVQ